MNAELSDIFNDRLTSKSIVVTATQTVSIFAAVNREFFSWVQPIFFITNDAIDLLDDDIKPDIGIKIENGEYGLNIGTFKITCIRTFTSQTAIKILPLDYSSFKLEVEYQGDYALACDYFLMQSQKDNMDLLGGVGVQEIQQEPFTIQELREILESHYGTGTTQSVEVDQLNNEC